jgi:gamma-glutamyltranspeptidase/glutathione hydrolase
MTANGAIAAGHPDTVAAAATVLEDGGNAFDAALVALCMACVAEPVLTSLGGGGVMLARPAGAAPVIYDFFVHTPKRRLPADELDFFPIVADFGTAQQIFHIGLGSMATPGTVRGLFTVHRDLA